MLASQLLSASTVEELDFVRFEQAFWSQRLFSDLPELILWMNFAPYLAL